MSEVGIGCIQPLSWCLIPCRAGTSPLWALAATQPGHVTVAPWLCQAKSTWFFRATTPCSLHSYASLGLFPIPKVLLEESSSSNTPSYCLFISLCPNCSFPLVNHGHVVVVFHFLKLLIRTCCLCLHRWTQECFPVPMSGCVVSHAPAPCWDGNLDMCAEWELQRVSTGRAVQMTGKWGPQDMLQSK